MVLCPYDPYTPVTITAVNALPLNGTVLTIMLLIIALVPGSVVMTVTGISLLYIISDYTRYVLDVVSPLP